MVLTSTLAVSLLLAAPPVAAPTPFPLGTPIPIQCLDASGNPIPEAANPATAEAGGPLTPPKVRKRVSPVWPRKTAGCQLPITVMVEAVVTTKGDVCEAIVLGELSPGCEPFGQALRAAVKKWKFKPARIGDKPVAVYFINSTSFSRPPIP